MNGRTSSIRAGATRFGLRALALAVATLVLGCSGSTVAAPIGGPSPKPPQPGCAAAREPNSLCILILGDSIADGVPLEGDRRWWRQLQRDLAAALPNRTIQVDDWAIPGAQISVLESAARDQREVGTYDIAIVIEGVNDEHVMGAEAWRPRYEASIESLEAKGLTVIVTAPPPIFENGAFGTRYEPFAQAVRDVASRGRPLLDISSRWRADGPTVAATYYADLIHQSAGGQDVMASMARDIVLEAIPAEPAGP